MEHKVDGDTNCNSCARNNQPRIYNKYIRYGLRKLNNKCYKMYKISNKIIKSITETMKKWKVELIVEGKTFIGVEIQKIIFQGYALSALPWEIANIPLNHILRKVHRPLQIC